MSTTPVSLTAEPRDTTGTRTARRLRRDGKLPAIVYGHGEQNQSVTLPLKETLTSLQHGAHLFTLDIAGKSEQVLVKDVQYNYLGDEILHVDLFRVNLDEEVTSPVLVVLAGEPEGTREGAILTQMRDQIEVVCKVRDLPDEIRVDVSTMKVGDVLHVSEVSLPDGVRLPEGDADFTIATVAQKKIKAEDDEVAPLDGAEPEIIGDKETAVQPGENAEENADPNA